jgi:LysM repeat protein
MKKGIVSVALFAALAASPASHAYTHVVQPGETLAQIAQRVYGDTRYETVLVGANALDARGESAIVVGMRLEVPAPRHHKVKARETWGDLALRYLGDGARADVLARANDAVSWVPPVEGQEIAVPAVVSHIAGERETMTDVSRRYWNDPNRAWELNGYNGNRHEAPLRRGEIVLVPMAAIVLTEAGREEARRACEVAAGEGGGAMHDAQRRADTELPLLLADLRGARYVDAVARGNRLLGLEGLTKPELAAIHRALVEAYVALDAVGAAAGACAAWRAHAADPHMDPRLTSPKIRAACAAR